MTVQARKSLRESSSGSGEIGGRWSVSDKELSVLQMIDRGFQHDVLEKLSRMEAKMEMLVGNGQPGRMTLAEDRIVELERNDVRRTVIERFVCAGIGGSSSADAVGSQSTKKLKVEKLGRKAEHSAQFHFREGEQYELSESA